MEPTADIDDFSTVQNHRQLIAAAMATLRGSGKVVSTCTIQTALREYQDVNLTLREIIEARRPR